MTLKAQVENKLDSIELKKTDEIALLNEKVAALTKDKADLRAKWIAAAKSLETFTEAKKHEWYDRPNGKAGYNRIQ